MKKVLATSLSWPFSVLLTSTYFPLHSCLQELFQTGFPHPTTTKYILWFLCFLLSSAPLSLLPPADSFLCLVSDLNIYTWPVIPSGPSPLSSKLVYLLPACSLAVNHLVNQMHKPSGSWKSSISLPFSISVPLSLCLYLLANLSLPVSCLWPTEACLYPFLSPQHYSPPLFTPQKQWWQPRLIFRATFWSLSPPLTPRTWA